VSGAAAGAVTDDWSSENHEIAKTITNAVVNHWGDGPETPAGVRDRLARDVAPIPSGLVAGGTFQSRSDCAALPPTWRLACALSGKACGRRRLQ
jgi:hypothetical protein